MATYIGTPTTAFYTIGRMFSYHHWEDITELSMDILVDKILTGQTMDTIRPDDLIMNYFPSSAKFILDFGCGIGRNSFSYAYEHPEWKITGYDNKNMIERSREFHIRQYGNSEFPTNLTFNSNWSELKFQYFDVIFLLLVAQHIFAEDLAKYLADIKSMAPYLIVAGRRYNDDNGKNTWQIIEDCGLVPCFFYNTIENSEVVYTAHGPPNDHHMAIYNIS